MRSIFSAQCPAALNQRQTVAIGQRREKSGIEFPSFNLVTVLNSKVNWRIREARSVVTVIEGSVSVERPMRITLGQYDQYFVRKQTLEGPPLRPTREEADATARWTERFFRAPPSSLFPRQPPFQVPPRQPPRRSAPS